jgi:hypothetical protein
MRQLWSWRLSGLDRQFLSLAFRCFVPTLVKQFDCLGFCLDARMGVGIEHLPADPPGKRNHGLLWCALLQQFSHCEMAKECDLFQ